MFLTNFFACRHDTGAVLPNATATVYLTGTTTPASIFNAAGGSIANPLTADSAGRVIFKVADGVYDIAIVSADGNYTAPPIQQYNVADVAVLSAQVNALSAVALTNQGLVYDTLAHMNADLAHAANTLAVVYADGAPANNGFYAKIGASGTGSWNNTGLVLPSTFATDLVATANAAAAAQATANTANTKATAALTASAASAAVINMERADDATLRGLAPNPVGAWFFDRYDSTAKAIPNAVSQQKLPANILRGASRQFNNSTYWAKSSATVADLAVAAPDGTITASTINLAGGGAIIGGTNGHLPAGAYSLWVWVKSNTGSSQSFKMQAFSNSLQTSAAQTATSTWQRIGFTFSVTSPVAVQIYAVMAVDGATAANLQLWKAQVYAGSVDLGDEGDCAGHILLGGDVYDTAYSGSYANGLLDIHAGGFGTVQFPNALAMGPFTSMALVKKVGSGNSYDPFLASMADFSKFAHVLQQGDAMAAYFEGLPNAPLNQFAGTPYNLNGDGLHLLSLRYDGNIISIWFDDYQMVGLKATQTTFHACSDFYFGTLGGGYTSIKSNFAFSSAALWDYAISPAEFQRSYRALVMRAALSNQIATPRPKNVVVFEGDSQTGGFSFCYPYSLVTTLSPKAYVTDAAVSGSFIPTLESRAQALDAILPTDPQDRLGRRFTLSVLLGSNDLQDSHLDVNAWIARYQAYLTARRAAGWDRILVITVPESYYVQNANRLTVNTALTTTFVSGGYADACADIAANANIGATGASSNTTYFATDKLHMNAAAHAIVASIVGPVIDAQLL